MSPHVPRPLPKAKRSTRSVSWLVCARCGLIYLKNDATARAIRKPCPGLEGYDPTLRSSGL